MKKREPVPVHKAIVIYGRFGSWRKVAEVVRRQNGLKFAALSIQAAVRRYDRRVG